MAKCAICGKGQISGNRISHSHVKTRRKWAPNVQPVKAVIGGTTRKITVCSRCLRSGKVERA